MFKNLFRPLLFVAAITGLGSLGCAAQTTEPTAATPLLQFDFNGKDPWPGSGADVMPSTPIDVLTTYETQPVGTPVADKPSGAWVMKTEIGKVNLPWIATYSSGWLPVSPNAAAGQAKLAMDYWASSAKPVTIRLESYDSKKLRTGGVQTTLTPKAASVFERHELDLAVFKPEGAGQFNARDGFIQISFVVANPAWPDEAAHELRIDNLSLSATP